ncbi:MAG TPA: hypothetical protein VFR81_21860 [Longimicrobium sp.]|nr:hypothetical protein [Longimicrobium sp.]
MGSKKLNLDVDQLSVESFEPQGAENARRGTVRGHGLFATVDGTCYDGTCRGYGTCGIYPCKQIP